MIFTQMRLLMAVASLAILIGLTTWIYFKGKSAAKQECLEEQAKVIQIWEQELSKAQEKNQILAEDLAAKISDLETAKNARTKRIIQYVKDNLDSDTVIFDADGLSILNDAQKGNYTISK